jgi:hypothetical protein
MRDQGYYSRRPWEKLRITRVPAALRTSAHINPQSQHSETPFGLAQYGVLRTCYNLIAGYFPRPLHAQSLWFPLSKCQILQRQSPFRAGRVPTLVQNRLLMSGGTRPTRSFPSKHAPQFLSRPRRESLGLHTTTVPDKRAPSTNIVLQEVPNCRVRIGMKMNKGGCHRNSKKSNW